MPNIMTKSRCLDNLNDRERLQDSLEWEGYTEIKMKSDGNCQFRALADQIYKTSDFHKRVRQEIIKQLKSHPKFYKGLVDEKMEFPEYVKNMSNNSVWGDEVTLKAAADVYGVKIVLITSFERSTKIVILPKSQKEQDKVIYLSYLAGIHYNSVYKNEDPSEGSKTVSTKLRRKKEKEKEEKIKEEEEEKKKEEKKREKDEKKKDKEEKKKAKLKKEKKNKNHNLHLSDIMPTLEQEDDSYFLN